MTTYPNGQWPESMFVVIGSGTDQHGPWKHITPPGTAARWAELYRLAFEKYGVRLRVTPGWNMYRPLWVQKVYRTALGIWAAQPGTSSHGGSYGGVESAAIDVQNWWELAPDSQTLAWSRFVALCKLVGFRTNFVTPIELWHIGDFNDLWVIPAFAAVTVKPHTTARPEPFEENDMPRYIWTNENAPVNGVGYALIDSGYRDGVIVTGDPTVAAQLSRIAADPRTGVPAAPVWLSRQEFNAQCAAATALWRKHSPLA